MAESAGVISAEIQLDLKKLDAQIKQVSEKLKGMGGNMETQVSKPAQGIGGVFSKLKLGAVAAFAAIGAAVMKAAAFVKESLKVYQENHEAVTRLGIVLKSTGADAWTTKDQLEAFANEVQKSTGVSTKSINEMQTVLLKFGSVTGSVFNDASKAAIDMAAVMGGDAKSAANTLGRALQEPTKAIATLQRQGVSFTESQKQQIEQMEKAGNRQGAQRVILEQVEKAYGGAAKAAREANKEQVDYATAISNLQHSIGREAKELVAPVVGAFAKIIQGISGAIDKAYDFNEAMRRIKEQDYGKISNEIDAANVALLKAKDNVVILQNEFARAVEKAEQIKTEVRLEYVANESGEEYMARWNAAIKEAEKEAASLKMRLVEAQKAVVDAGKDQKDLQDAEAERLRNESRAEEERAKAAEESAKRMEAFQKMQSDYANQVATIQELERTGIIESAEATDKRAEALAAYVEKMTAMGVEVKSLDPKVFSVITQELDKQIPLLTEQQKLLQQQGANKELQDKIDAMNLSLRTVGLEGEKLRKVEREISLEALRMSDAYKNASDEMKTQIEEVHNKLEDARDAAANGGNPYAELQGQVEKYGNASIGIMGQVFDIMSSNIQKETQMRIAELDKQHAALTANLDKERQERLFAAGLIDADNAEQYAMDLERLKETGDEKLILEADRALQKQLIEEEFAEKQKALDAQMAQEKAELEYKAALAQWKMQVLQAIASTALAVTMAGMNMWPVPAIPMMATAATTGTIQLASLQSAKPVKTYSQGGIVPGNSYSGDKVLGRLNSGERVLTQQDQKTLSNFLDGNSGGGNSGQMIHITLPLDGRVLAETTVKLINNRVVILNERGIAR